MRTLDKAWRSVKSSCIANCFTKAGFRFPDTSPYEEDLSSDSSLLDDVALSWSRLLQTKNDGLEDVDCIDFIFVDDNLPVSSTLSDDDTIQEYRNEIDEAEEEASNEGAIQSKSYNSKGAKAALFYLRGYFETSPNTEDKTFDALFKLGYDLEKTSFANMKQKKIVDYI
jgi:hypothetical protein